MAERKQWVNLTKDNKWVGAGNANPANQGEMGQQVTAKIRFDEHKRAIGWLTVTADPQNAVYSDSNKEGAYRFPGCPTRPFITNDQGEKDLDITVSLAGGDKYSVTATDRSGHTVLADDVLTRRKLYFQVIRMNDAAPAGSGSALSAITGADKNGMRNEFWNPANSVYINMVEIQPTSATIPQRLNFNDEDGVVKTAILSDARAAYNDAKDPYCFVILVVRKNGVPGDEVLSLPATLNPPSPYALTTSKVLFDSVDPNEEYYGSLEWKPAGGVTQTIGKARLTRRGNYGIEIDTAGLAPGTGTLKYRMRVLEVCGAGFSEPTNNLTVVASENAGTGATRVSAKILATIVHEIGHKIGMVPGPEGTQLLDKQASTYYDGHGDAGPHCHKGIAKPLPADLSGGHPTCTMFGKTREVKSVFCDDCRKSLRKLDLRAARNVGIRTRF